MVPIAPPALVCNRMSGACLASAGNAGTPGSTPGSADRAPVVFRTRPGHTDQPPRRPAQSLWSTSWSVSRLIRFPRSYATHNLTNGSPVQANLDEIEGDPL